MAEKPTIQEIRGYLNERDLLGLRNAAIEQISRRNHLVYRVEKNGQVYALRMINPESYRANEWVSIQEEYEILKMIEPSSSWPKVYALAEDFVQPFLIQEFVTATCFNDLKPLSEDHLKNAAYTIAKLNSTHFVSPISVPFLKKYTVDSYQQRCFVWYYRLLHACVCSLRKDVVRWALRILPILKKTARVLSQFERSLPKKDYLFHFDGAHCGNTYWRERVEGYEYPHVIFLDWQRVSWRNDPTFTLVRFATSTGDKGVVAESVFTTLITAYLEVRSAPNFRETARIRLLERQVSDLVWVLWDFVRRRDSRPVAQGTSVTERFEVVNALLQNY